MITKKTVLVLGAGASSDYGYPLGRGLRDLVCALPGHPSSVAAVLEGGHSAAVFHEFVDTLRHYGVGSVDWFLEDHPAFISVGKAAMAACLIPYEDPDRLFPPGAPSNHWYELLLTSLLLPDGTIDTTPLSVVTFNYDRSLEHYLFRVISTRLKSDKMAQAALNDLEVVHVHGVLGGLVPLDPNGREYSSELTGEAVAKAAEEIIVVGEAQDSSAAFERASSLLGQAERIIFLGFGFHPDSVRRLQIFSQPWDEQSRQDVEVRATSSGIPDHAWLKITREVLSDAIPPRTPKANQHVYDYLHAVQPLDL